MGYMQNLAAGAGSLEDWVRLVDARDAASDALIRAQESLDDAEVRRARRVYTRALRDLDAWRFARVGGE